MSSGEEGHLEQTGKEGKRYQEVAPSLSLILFHPDSSSHKLVHHYLRCTHMGHCGLNEALATRRSVETLRDCVDEYQMFFSVREGLVFFCLVFSVLRLFRQCYVFCVLCSLEELTEAKRSIVW